MSSIRMSECGVLIFRFIPLTSSDTAPKKTKSVFPVKLVEEDKLSWQSKLGHLPLGTWAKYLQDQHACKETVVR